MNAQQADFNLVEISNVPYAEGCNDIWGYVDSSGTEYALVGTREATAVLSLEDPANPVERAYIPGATSTWRDIKTWKNYAYVIADVGNDGLLIINMEGAPDNITHNFYNVPFQYNGSPGSIQKCHNVYIDEKGVLYLSGCNTGSSGVMMFDLNDDPENPKFLGAENDNYSHDNVARGDTLWSSDLSQGLSIYDVSDKDNPVELGRQTTTSNFCHNAWFSDDGKYVFTTDERANAYMDSYDVSDMNNIKRLDVYRPLATENRGVIPHNTHYLNGYLVVSWYTDGVKIVDASRPGNMIEVGSFDSYQGADGGFNGCWGAYPFLPSGLILINDIQSGLYVLQPTYQRACYLEGRVTDAVTKDPIQGVSVEIQSSNLNQSNTSFEGEYATGQIDAGTFDVIFSHPDYIDDTISVDLTNGVVTQLDIELKTRPFYTATGLVIDARTKEPVPNAVVTISNDNESFETTANAAGLFDVIVLEDKSDITYEILSGAWGYLHKVITDQVIDQNVQLTIELDEGYQDDFIFDLGWTTSGTAPRGRWELGVPNGTTVFGELANPNADVTGDLGESCYVTGNADTGGAGDDDVDDGIVVLTSPIMDLSSYGEPHLSYRTWFYNGSRPAPNDSLVVTINNGIEEIELEVVNISGSVWNDSSIFILSDLMELTDSMTIRVQVSDDPQEGHVVEGGFDEFRVVDKLSTSSQDNTSQLDWSVAPTVTSDEIIISVKEEEVSQIEIFDNQGRSIYLQSANSGQLKVHTAKWSKGLYHVVLKTQEGQVEAKSFIRQ